MPSREWEPATEFSWDDCWDDLWDDFCEDFLEGSPEECWLEGSVDFWLGAEDAEEVTERPRPLLPEDGVDGKGGRWTRPYSEGLNGRSGAMSCGSSDGLVAANASAATAESWGEWPGPGLSGTWLWWNAWDSTTDSPTGPAAKVSMSALGGSAEAGEWGGQVVNVRGKYGLSSAG